MKRFNFLYFFLFVFSLNAQEKPLLVIEEDSIDLNEFKSIFYKNTHEVDITKEYLDNYIDLFVNFKLKVKEAESLGLDTLDSFINELKGYERQLSKPYLKDTAFNNRMMSEAYERIMHDIRASHILFSIDEKSNDTNLVFDKALDIRESILNQKYTFEEAARKYSADQSASFNGGDLGYFTAFMMVYPFENATYSTSVGDISMPVRTKYGYHLIKVVDKRKALGKVQVAHIVFKTGEGASEKKNKEAYNKIIEIQTLLESGASFQELAEKHSEDRSSAVKGGALPSFGVGKMVPEFENASFSLKNIGDQSKPFQTKYGWHIVSLLNKEDIGDFNTEKNNLRRKIANDSRSKLSEESLIRKLKSEYPIKHFSQSFKHIKRAIKKEVELGIFSREDFKILDKHLLKINDKYIYQKDFIEYLLSNQVSGCIFDDLYSSFVNQELLIYEENNLSSKYPEYKALLKEYREGILLFDLTNKKVWNKAIEDSLGLLDFFNNNNQKYVWESRLRATIFNCKDAKVAKSVRNYLYKKQRQSKSSWSSKLLYRDTVSQSEFIGKINAESPLSIQVNQDKFLKGSNKYIDMITWKKGISKDIKNEDGSIVLIYVHDILEPQEKLLSETKGKVISDYQNLLDKQWIAQLREKYKFQVNFKLLYSLVK